MYIYMYVHIYIYIYISYLVIDNGRLKCGSQVTQEFDFAPESVQKDGTDTMITSWLFMSIPAIYALSTPWFPMSSILTTGCVFLCVSFSLKIWFQGHWKASRGRSALATTARHQALNLQLWSSYPVVNGRSASERLGYPYSQQIPSGKLT